MKIFRSSFVRGFAWGCVFNTGLFLCLDNILAAGIWLIIGSILLFLGEDFWTKDR